MKISGFVGNRGYPEEEEEERPKLQSMEWVRGKPIGHGSFSTVNLAIPRNNAGQPPLMAVKSSESLDSTSLSMLVNEKQILDQFRDCPEIIRCHGDDTTVEGGVEFYNVFLEYASGGSLADHVRNSGGKLPESDVRAFTRSILKGLRYIHEKNYVHCDIKLQNILLSSDGGVKIADFGLAKKAGGERKAEVRGTPLYMSPEIVTDGECEAPADVWALGCAVVEMVTGKPVWRANGENAIRLLMRIGMGGEVPEIPGELSEEGKDFLGKCFIRDQKKRWTAEMLLSHPFMAGECLPEEREFSPRNPFEFSDWVSISSSPRTEVVDFDQEAVMDRLNFIVSEEQRPNWSISGDWVTVR